MYRRQRFGLVQVKSPIGAEYSSSENKGADTKLRLGYIILKRVFLFKERLGREVRALCFLWSVECEVKKSKKL